MYVMSVVCAMLASSAVVVLDFVEPETVGDGRTMGREPFVDGNIEELSATATQKVGMGLDDAVETHVALVDREHLGGTVLDEKTKRVVNRRFRERRYLSRQRVVDFVGCRVGQMLGQIFHHGQPLDGWLDVVCKQVVVNFFIVHSFACNRYNFILVQN